MLRCSRSRHLTIYYQLLYLVQLIRAQPDDGHRDAPKHVVVASPVASYIIKLVVVLTVIHLFKLYSHTTGMSNLEMFLDIKNRVLFHYLQNNRAYGETSALLEVCGTRETCFSCVYACCSKRSSVCQVATGLRNVWTQTVFTFSLYFALFLSDVNPVWNIQTYFSESVQD